MLSLNPISILNGSLEVCKCAENRADRPVYSVSTWDSERMRSVELNSIPSCKTGQEQISLRMRKMFSKELLAFASRSISTVARCVLGSQPLALDLLSERRTFYTEKHSDGIKISPSHNI